MELPARPDKLNNDGPCLRYDDDMRVLRYASIVVLSSLLAPASLPYSLQSLEGLVNIRFLPDVRLFAVMAALNAAGYDRDLGDSSSNPARSLVRERLSVLDADLRDRLRTFYREHQEDPDELALQSSYVSLSLVLNGPPLFELSLETSKVPPDARAVAGFEQLVKEVWEQGRLEEIWARLRPVYVEEVEAYRPALRSAILETLGYLRTDARLALDRQVIFIPDLLNGFGIVNARNIGDDYYLLVGPARPGKRPVRSLRHEYLHFMIDPLIRKYTGHLPEAEPFLKLVKRQPQVLSRYEADFPLVVTESLIKTVERRLDQLQAEEKLVEMIADFDKGLVLAPFFDEALAAFDRRSESLQEYFAELVEGIRFDNEKTREDWVNTVRLEIQNRRVEREARSKAEAEARSAIRELLEQANRRLLSREFESAQLLLEAVLKREPANASALFGMGQIFAHRQAFDQALDLYERAARSADARESWIAAWSFLRRGNIYLFLEERDLARKEWGRVLGLEGDLHGAREAAQAALSTP